MAKIKWSAIGITAASGKTGGSVFSFNRAGAYVRNWAKPVNAQTGRQTFMRSLWANISQRWGMLTEEAINLWRNEARNIQVTDGFGDTRDLNGFSYFMRVNQNRTHGMGLPVTDHPLELVPLPSVDIEALNNGSSGNQDVILSLIHFNDGKPNTDYTASIGFSSVPGGKNLNYGSVKNKFADRMRKTFTTDAEGDGVVAIKQSEFEQVFGRKNANSTLFVQVHTHSEAGQKSNPVTATSNDTYAFKVEFSQAGTHENDAVKLQVFHKDHPIDGSLLTLTYDPNVLANIQTDGDGIEAEIGSAVDGTYELLIEYTIDGVQYVIGSAEIKIEN